MVGSTLPVSEGERFSARPVSSTLLQYQPEAPVSVKAIFAGDCTAWVMIFAIAPLAGIYYPISTLPDWLRPLAWAMPPAHVFEGMRSVMFGHGFRLDLLASAVTLNCAYLAAGVALFLWVWQGARVRGALLNVGE